LHARLTCPLTLVQYTHELVTITRKGPGDRACRVEEIRMVQRPSPSLGSEYLCYASFYNLVCTLVVSEYPRLIYLYIWGPNNPIHVDNVVLDLHLLGSYSNVVLAEKFWEPHHERQCAHRCLWVLLQIIGLVTQQPIY
jgi:hypothetical protein